MVLYCLAAAISTRNPRQREVKPIGERTSFTLPTPVNYLHFLPEELSGLELLLKRAQDTGSCKVMIWSVAEKMHAYCIGATICSVYVIVNNTYWNRWHYDTVYLILIVDVILLEDNGLSRVSCHIVPPFNLSSYRISLWEFINSLMTDTKYCRYAIFTDGMLNLVSNPHTLTVLFCISVSFMDPIDSIWHVLFQ